MSRIGSQGAAGGPYTELARRTLLIWVAAVGTALVGVPVAGGASLQQLVVGDLFIIRTLDPGRTIETTSMMVNKALYDTLVTFQGEDVKTPVPSLAVSWAPSADGRAYTFRLKQGVKFASGNPLTADDVKWSIERIMNMKATTAFLVEGVVKVDAPEPGTVVIHLKDPDPALLAKLTSPSLGILDSKLVKENGGDAGPDASTKDKAEAYLNTHSAGSGPFILSTLTPEQEIVLVKNPTYWREPAKIDRVVIRNIAEPAAREMLVKKGDLDIALNVGQDQITSLKRTGLRVESSPVAIVSFLQLNLDPAISGGFANPDVQQAVRYAIDYDGLLAIAGPGATALSGLMPSIFPGSPDPRHAVKTDRARAVELLKKANVPDVSADLTFYQGQSVNGVVIDLIAQKIQADLAAVGIKLKLAGKPNSLARSEWRAGKSPVGLFLWVADYADPSNYMVFLPGGGVGLRANWKEQSSVEARELAKLGYEARIELDAAKRAALYENVERRLAAAGPFIPLFQPAAPYAYGAKIKGVTYHSGWAVDFYTVSRDG